MGCLRRSRGFSLLEAIVALTILLGGIVAVVRFFPMLFESTSQAMLQTRAAMLAQRKAQEILRDDDTSSTLARTIAYLNTPTAPVAFPEEPALSYSFSGRSVLYPETDQAHGTPAVARVIVRYSANYRSSQDVIYELQFFKP